MPLILNKKRLFTGIAMLVTFLACVVLVFMPIFDGKTGMEAADDLFNSLSKGSSYYIPEVEAEVGLYSGLEFNIALDVLEKEQADLYTQLFEGAGATVQLNDKQLLASGDFGALTVAALRDADDFFTGKEGLVNARYSAEEARPIIYHWHQVFTQVKEYYAHEQMHRESLYANQVMTKALEPSYNFAGIATSKVSDKAALTAFLLLLYLGYTLWYGFGVMFLFEGLGIVVSNGAGKET